VLEVNERVTRPQALSKLFPCNNLTWMFEERPQQFDWLTGQIQSNVASVELT
jgi:hypothetical protein